MQRLLISCFSPSVQGVGGGVVYRNRVIHGSRWSAGEVGHQILYPGGHPCICGNRGCVEQYVSGTALLRSVSQATGKQLTRGEEIWREWEAQPSVVEPCLRLFVHDFLSLVLHNMRLFFDPDRIVLGGGVVQSHPMWEEWLYQELDSLGEERSLVQWSRLGKRAGVYGAAKLALDRCSSKLDK